MRKRVLLNVILLLVLLISPITPPLLCLTHITKAFFRRLCFSSFSLCSSVLSCSSLRFCSSLCFCPSLLFCSGHLSFSCLASTSSLLLSSSWASHCNALLVIDISNNPSRVPTWASHHFSSINGMNLKGALRPT